MSKIVFYSVVFKFQYIKRKYSFPFLQILQEEFKKGDTRPTKKT